MLISCELYNFFGSFLRIISYGCLPPFAGSSFAGRTCLELLKTKVVKGVNLVLLCFGNQLQEKMPLLCRWMPIADPDSPAHHARHALRDVHLHQDLPPRDVRAASA